MNGYLGRDKVWNEQIWGEIDKAVREEVGRIRVAQKVFASAVVNNMLPVLVNALAPGVGALTAGDDQFQPFVELSREFVLSQAQVDGEESMRLAPSLARLSASEIANAEDALLFLGSKCVSGSQPPLIGQGVTVTNKGAVQPGFVDLAANNKPPTKPSGATSTGVGDIIGAVADGMADLNGRDQPGPFALFLSPKRYAQTFAPTERGQLQTPGDQTNRVVTGGFYMVNSLSNRIGILVSLSGEPAKIVLGAETMTAFTNTDVQGNYHFRVFERIQLVVRDTRAFQTLQFP